MIKSEPEETSYIKSINIIYENLLYSSYSDNTKENLVFINERPVKNDQLIIKIFKQFLSNLSIYTSFFIIV
jgi:hypothetical protein